MQVRRSLILAMSPPIVVPYGNKWKNIVIIVPTIPIGVLREGVARAVYTGILLTCFPVCHMINNTSLQTFLRLSQKNLESQFQNELIRGLNCSPFEANAIIDVMFRIYSPFLSSNGSLLPGQMLFTVLSVDNSPSLSLAESKMVTVTLTMDKPDEDLQIRENFGVIALRQHRIQRVATEAFMQDGILGAEDLAYRLFNCGMRTISRDLADLRKRGIIVPLRSTVHDMGRTISHRAMIVKLWLQGKEYSDISRDAFHSVSSVQNYVDKFKRVVTLVQDGYDIHTVAFLVKISAGLVEEYFNLYKNNELASHRRLELDTFLKKKDFSTSPQGGTCD